MDTLLRTLPGLLLMSTFACTPDTSGLVEGGAPPMRVHGLSTVHTCSAADVDADTQLTTSTRDMQLANAPRNFLPFIVIVDAIRQHPTETAWASSWQHPLEDLLVDTSAYVTQAGETEGRFVVEIGMRVSGSWSSLTGYGSYTARSSIIELPTHVLRWSDHAVDGYGLFEGCDPGSDTRFSREMFSPMKCWRDADEVPCDGVNYWP